MKLAIVGSRNYTDYQKVKHMINDYLGDISRDDLEIVSGGAPGVDGLAKRFSKIRKLPYKEFPANWNKYGLAAGPIRNQEIADYSDCCLAISYGRSPGTNITIKMFQKLGKPVKVIRIETLLEKSLE